MVHAVGLARRTSRLVPEPLDRDGRDQRHRVRKLDPCASRTAHSRASSVPVSTPCGASTSPARADRLTAHPEGRPDHGRAASPHLHADPAPAARPRVAGWSDADDPLDRQRTEQDPATRAHPRRRRAPRRRIRRHDRPNRRQRRRHLVRDRHGRTPHRGGPRARRDRRRATPPGRPSCDGRCTVGRRPSTAQVLDATPQAFATQQRTAARRRRTGSSGPSVPAPRTSTTCSPAPAAATTSTAADSPGGLVFVADPDRSSTEDGGWLVGFVHDETRHETDFVVLDAQAIERPAVAVGPYPASHPQQRATAPGSQRSRSEGSLPMREPTPYDEIELQEASAPHPQHPSKEQSCTVVPSPSPQAKRPRATRTGGGSSGCSSSPSWSPPSTTPSSTSPCRSSSKVSRRAPPICSGSSPATRSSSPASCSPPAASATGSDAGTHSPPVWPPSWPDRSCPRRRRRPRR